MLIDCRLRTMIGVLLAAVSRWRDVFEDAHIAECSSTL
jgi:hypothetical protein